MAAALCRCCGNTRGDFTLVERTDGTKMWAYKSMPLYYWYEDKAPGDISGDGVGDVWHLAIE